MRILFFITVVGLVIGSCSTVPKKSKTLIADRPAPWSYLETGNRVEMDSGFVYEFGSCIRYLFDSEEGVLIRDQGFDLRRDSSTQGERLLDTLRVKIRSAEVDSIFAEINEIDLWNYPEEFTDAQVSGTRTTVEPHGRYRLDVRLGERSAIVRWTDEIVSPISSRAEALRRLGRTIEQHLDDAMRLLPKQAIGCL